MTNTIQHLSTLRGGQDRKERYLCALFLCSALVALAGCSQKANSTRPDDTQRKEAVSGPISARSQSKGVDNESKGSEGNLPIPNDLAEDVRRAERLGALIHRQDQHAARATDAVFAAMDKTDTRVVGWVVAQEAQAVVVTFIGQDGGTPFPIYRVVSSKEGGAYTPQVLPEGSELTQRQVAKFAARQTALKTSFHQCSQNYNTVVLPASHLGKDGWLVYLIPATKEPEIVLVGGHFRIHVSRDGTSVISATSLSQDCLTVRPGDVPKTGGQQFVFFNQPDVDVPNESHVFLQLSHRLPFGIGTRRGLWGIEFGKVVLLEKSKREDNAAK